jgi:hypothetical protein
MMTSAKSKALLKTKLKPRKLPLLVDEPDQLTVIKHWRDEDHEKLLLLSNELGIAEGPYQFYELALALARKYHIAFQVSAPLGKWSDLAGAYLVVEVERLTANKRPGQSQLWACYQLIKRPEWSQFLGMGDNPRAPKTADSGEALRKQYQKFKMRPTSNLLRKVLRIHILENDLAQWESNLKDILRNPHP